MKLEVLLSVLNLDKKRLDKMNITTDCVVINQCDKEEYKKYKNFRIYSYKDRGISKSRNCAIEKSKGDILLLCDNDIIYNDGYDKIIIDAFKNNPKADIIFFNMKVEGAKQKTNKKNKRIHFYECLGYGSINMAIKKESIKNIKFNELFGSPIYYKGGEDSLFIVESLKNGLKLYCSVEYIGKMTPEKSTWFNGYNEKYFYDKGALFCAISKPFRKLLYIQYLLRHKYSYEKLGLKKAYKEMIKGGKDYLNRKGMIIDEKKI